MSDVTRILEAVEAGDRQAANRLLPLVYDELRMLAARQLAHEKPGQTLEATALVHEAYLRLVGPANAGGFANRRHFFGAAAEAMRRILVESARRKLSEKHGGNFVRQDVSSLDANTAAHSDPGRFLEMDEALVLLASQDSLAAELFKLRYFAGLTVEDAAEMLSLSRTEAYRRWTFLRAWLRCHFMEDETAKPETPEVG
jgi:RNA polymerase sigma factor (TIGR02999 family)